ncbi:MAG TPA: hypothetical protein DCX53_02455 [Anaerolineae bacterium]|nr:hypothetical protein [Anaerolineae bacterium]
MTEACQCSPDAGSEPSEIHVQSLGRNVCPTNGRQGKLVDTKTVMAMLMIPLTHVKPAQYYFCREADCPTVYYSTDGQIFNETYLRERVFQKNPNDGSVHVCYCFRHSANSIHEELESTGKLTVIESITNGIQAGQCACEVRNPQGTCCLGNVIKLLKKLQIEQQHI